MIAVLPLGLVGFALPLAPRPAAATSFSHCARGLGREPLPLLVAPRPPATLPPHTPTCRRPALAPQPLLARLGSGSLCTRVVVVRVLLAVVRTAVIPSVPRAGPLVPLIAPCGRLPWRVPCGLLALLLRPMPASRVGSGRSTSAVMAMLSCGVSALRCGPGFASGLLVPPAVVWVGLEPAAPGGVGSDGAAVGCRSPSLARLVSLHGSQVSGRPFPTRDSPTLCFVKMYLGVHREAPSCAARR